MWQLAARLVSRNCFRSQMPESEYRLIPVLMMKESSIEPEPRRMRGLFALGKQGYRLTQMKGLRMPSCHRC